MLYKQNLFIFYLVSKFNYIKTSMLPLLSVLWCSITNLGKSKANYLLFFILLLNILFFSFLIRSENSKINKLYTVISILIRGNFKVQTFFHTFIYCYYPLIDSSLSEFKVNKVSYNFISFTLSRFPAISEIDIFLQNIELLAFFFTYTKINFNLLFLTSKNIFDCCSFLHFMKLPILLK